MVFLHMETIFLCYMLKIGAKISFAENAIDENNKSYYDGFNDKKYIFLKLRRDDI